MNDRLQVVRAGQVVSLTLDRADKLNALDAALVERVLAALEDAAAAGVRLVVLEGAGKGFSGGFDFTGLADHTDGDLALRFLRIELMLQAVHYAPFATLALVHGACFGAAADLVASCTYRIAAPGARFRMPGLGFGVVLGTRRLAEVVGRANALSLLSTSRAIDADEALRMGLLTAVEDRACWPERRQAIAEAAERLPQESFTTLLRLTRSDLRQYDLAEVARSVARPGLKARIEDFLRASGRM